VRRPEHEKLIVHNKKAKISNGQYIKINVTEYQQIYCIAQDAYTESNLT